MALNFFKVSKGVTLKGQSSTPSSAEDGDIYFHSVDNTLYLRKNSIWVDLAAGNTSQGMLSTNDSQSSVTIASGTTLTHPNLSIQNTHTYTVNGALLTLITFEVESGGLLNVAATGAHSHIA